ncbi:hypothetical protein [Nostoc sp.]
MSKTPKLPKPPKAFKTPKVKAVKGYIKKDGTFVNPYFKGMPKFK